jgi:hypothetical protein
VDTDIVEDLDIERGRGEQRSISCEHRSTMAVARRRNHVHDAVVQLPA